MNPGLDIEIFPCAGGMGEGFRRAGVDFDMAIEIAEDHCDSYEANLHHRPFQMDARDFLKLARSGWRPGVQPIRMIVADPPCTPWSRAGKRMGESDPRDMLQVTCDLIAILRPLVYLIGNVPGLDDGPNLPITQRIIGGLSQYGYCTADIVRLDAANYGVPQHRVRPFWFGHLHGPCIQWPMPSHCDPAELEHPTLPGVERLLPWITCKDALGHLSMAELGRPIKLRKRNQNGAQHRSVEERPARVVGTSNLSDGNVLLSSDAPRSKKGKRDRDRGRVAQGNTVRGSDGEGVNRALEWPWARPATTVLADERLPPPGHHDEDYAIMSTDGDGVVISELAAAILQGFPPTWKFVGSSKKKRWSQIGQAMPPPLAHAVACSVVGQIAKTESES